MRMDHVSPRAIHVPDACFIFIVKAVLEVAQQGFTLSMGKRGVQFCCCVRTLGRAC